MKLKAKYDSEDYKAGQVISADLKITVKYYAPLGGFVTAHYTSPQDLLDEWEVVE